MWLMKPPMPDNFQDADERPCHSISRQHITNFSYPRSDFVHYYPKKHLTARNSQGSDSSPPQLVEDHGSDFSVEDDPQFRTLEANSWDSWHARGEQRVKSNHPALIDSAGSREVTARGPTLARGESSPTTRSPVDSGSQTDEATRLVATSCQDQVLQSPRTPQKACYSLFPSTDPSPKRSPARLQTCLDGQPPGLETSPLYYDFPSPPRSRAAITSGKNNATVTPTPGSSRATTSCSRHAGSSAASSLDSIPLLLRSPGPTPPGSPSTRSSSESPNFSSFEVRNYSPPRNNHRNISLSEISGQSSPPLPNLANTQRQNQPRNHFTNSRPLVRAGIYYDRPLPPLPTERSSSPPHISVFETDSDDEDGGEDDRPSSITESTRNLARRFMQGLVHHSHHHHHRHHKPSPVGREKRVGQRPDHKRSVSDEGPTTSASAAKSKGSDSSDGGSARIGIAWKLNAAAGYRKGGTTAAVKAAASRGVVSMDLPRGSASPEGGVERYGGQKAGRRRVDSLWMRILRRKGGD
ncbi:uncharacterized protein P884DRAFT_274837 [Thermothelomyces heterothallicus CBS 202.75]|uniref:uncharacterized protein n=1 Tax=Thermothelomyces heterothallicus CBS 202.75 TaxID=1149848 RepID=UPI0037426A0B